MHEIPDTADDFLAAGYTALKAADWPTARMCFEQALARETTPEAYDGLGIALWWLNEIGAAHQQRLLAYNGFRQRGETRRALLTACWLAREQLFYNSNAAAMQGWFARAERLSSELAPCPERAWFEIQRASVLETPQVLEQTALRVIEAARLFNDSSLEAFALAFCGQAQVILGRVGDGMARLDEAMAMATGGEVADFTTISEVFCAMLSACETAGDLARSEHWCRAAAEFARQFQCSFLSAYCRTTYGSLMTALGRWQEAETALLEAVQTFESGHRGLRVHAVIRLADLRIYQGKLEEAEVMLAGLEDQAAAAVPLARLWLAKGQLTLAKATLKQALKLTPAFTLHHLPALLLLIDVLLVSGDLDEAQRITGDLADLAAKSQSRLFIAQVELIAGRVNLQAGRLSAAEANFNAALGYLHSFEQSLLAGQVRLRMAQSLRDSDPHGAVAWAKGALATFERIGAQRDAAEAASLLRLLGAAGTSMPRLGKTLTQREQEIAALIASGLTNREIAERLVISPRTVEHHVTRILAKLNLRSRTEAAAFAASGRLSAMIEQAGE